MSPGPAASSSVATLARLPDITAIVGQHVHIVQTIRILNGKFVVFGRRGTCGCTTQAADSESPAVTPGQISREVRSRIACQPGGPLVLR